MNISTFTLNSGEYQIIIRDAFPYDDPVPDLNQPFEYEYGNLGNALAKYIVECWQHSQKLRSCLLHGLHGGPSRLGEHTAIVHNHRCIVGIGADMLTLEIPSLKLVWSTQVDDATCFGVYHAENHRCYISHGEMDIARVDYEGNLIWASGGADIFTNGFELFSDHIEVVDFNDQRYHVDIETGGSRIIDPPSSTRSYQ